MKSLFVGGCKDGQRFSTGGRGRFEVLAETPPLIRAGGGINLTSPYEREEYVRELIAVNRQEEPIEIYVSTKISLLQALNLLVDNYSPKKKEESQS